MWRIDIFIRHKFKCDEPKNIVGHCWHRAINDKKRCKSIKSPFELIVDVSNDLLKAVRVVDGIAEPGSVNDGQSELDTAFLNLYS